MVVKAAYNAAEKNANSVCGFFFYQPKQPDAVKIEKVLETRN